MVVWLFSVIKPMYCTPSNSMIKCVANTLDLFSQRYSMCFCVQFFTNVKKKNRTDYKTVPIPSLFVVIISPKCNDYILSITVWCLNLIVLNVLSVFSLKSHAALHNCPDVLCCVFRACG